MTTSHISIRPARPRDANKIHELHTASVRTLCGSHYSTDIIEAWLADRTPAGYLPAIQRGVLFVAERHERILGFGHFAPGEVVALFVDPAVARQGLGRALLAHAMTHARENWSGPVRLEATLNARRFYESAGFRQVGRATTRRSNVDIPVVVMLWDPLLHLRKSITPE